jgi:thiamine biosynthesis protein ThiS
MELMSLQLNGEPLQLPPATTLEQLLRLQGIAADTVATACNGRFVSRTARTTHALQPGDAVLTFQAITGG